MGSRSAGLKPFTDEAFAEYLRCLQHRAALAASAKITAPVPASIWSTTAPTSPPTIICSLPLRVLWGAEGTVGRCFDPLKEWQQVATNVTRPGPARRPLHRRRSPRTVARRSAGISALNEPADRDAMLAASAASACFAMSQKKDTVPLPEDLRVLLTVIRKNGFAAAADELGLSPGLCQQTHPDSRNHPWHAPAAPHQSPRLAHRGRRTCAALGVAHSR